MQRGRGHYANCDGLTSDGCERSLHTLMDCGACDVPCDLPGATESCSTGTCQLVTCDPGFSNCDPVTSNGCEGGNNLACAGLLCQGCGDGSCGALIAAAVGAGLVLKLGDLPFARAPSAPAKRPSISTTRPKLSRWAQQPCLWSRERSSRPALG